jgi:hypothetical protein
MMMRDVENFFMGCQRLIKNQRFLRARISPSDSPWTSFLEQTQLKKA